MYWTTDGPLERLISKREVGLLDENFERFNKMFITGISRPSNKNFVSSGELKSLYIPHEDLIDFKILLILLEAKSILITYHKLTISKPQKTLEAGVQHTCKLQNCLDKINRKIGL